MRPRRAAVVIPVVKGLVCGVIGVSFLALSFTLKGPEWSFVPFALFVVSLPCLLAAVVYLIAAFLIARDHMVWRMPGALLVAAVSLAISGTLVWTFRAVGGAPLAISIAFALVWVGALLPVFRGAFRQPGSPTGSARSEP